MFYLLLIRIVHKVLNVPPLTYCTLYCLRKRSEGRRPAQLSSRDFSAISGGAAFLFWAPRRERKVESFDAENEEGGERSRGDCKAIPQSPKQHIWGQLNCLRRFASPLSFPLFDLFFGARRNEEGLFAAFFSPLPSFKSSSL